MTEYTIELKPYFHKSGTKARGDREIWVDGECWGHVEMIGHGCHGPSYEFSAMDGGIALRFKNHKTGEWSESRYGQLESVHPSRKNRRQNGDIRTAEDHIIEKARALIADGRLRDPKVIFAERAEANKRYTAARAAERVQEALVREGLISLWKRIDLTNAERESLSVAFKDIFHSPIEKADTPAEPAGVAHDDP